MLASTHLSQQLIQFGVYCFEGRSPVQVRADEVAEVLDWAVWRHVFEISFLSRLGINDVERFTAYFHLHLLKPDPRGPIPQVLL